MNFYYEHLLRFWFLSYMIAVVNSKEIRAVTKSGVLIGEAVSVEFDGENKFVQRYLGIPYAKAPVGQRRFARPEPYGAHASPYNATFHRPHCMQTVPLYYKHLEPYDKSENCLFLNIYIPGDHLPVSSDFPIMVYIHGGSFGLGGGDIYSGDILSAFNDVITVTINYRLNVFGFLSNGTKGSGNFGLWDMRLALQWIHDNIRSFGGDPTKVTLFGNSAGGAAVMYQAMFPGNEGLFQRIIAQSGCNLAYWAFQNDPEMQFIQYASKVGCLSYDFDAIMKCLRQKPADQLQVSTFDYVPAIDREFLPEKPTELLKGNSEAGKAVSDFFASIDFMNGVTSQDGAVSVPVWKIILRNADLDLDDGVPRFYFEKYVPSRVHEMIGKKPSKALTDTVIYQYTDWTDSENPKIIRDKLVDLESDITFNVPALEASRKHKSPMKQKGNNYFYVFDHKPSFAPEPEWITGAIHTMEIPYIFGLHEALEGKLIQDYFAIDPFRVTQQDIKLSKLMMTLWTNFAKSGDPNTPVSIATEAMPEWPTFDTSTQSYLNIEMNMTSQSVRHHLIASRDAFWSKVVPTLSDCEITSDTSSLAVNMTLIVIHILFATRNYNILW